MRPIRKTLSSATSTTPVPMDLYRDPFNVSLAVSLPAGTSLTYTVEYTVDDVFSNTFDPATATWVSVTGMAAQTTGTQGNIAFPVTAIRLRVSAFTSGSATLTIIQAGVKGA